MKIDILTLFPKMFKGPFEESIVKRAQEKSLVEIKIHNLRNWAKDKRGTVDDRPYGGGTGMILMVEPIYKALEELKMTKKNSKIILLSPSGRLFNQQMAREFSKLSNLILICGHYEGVDDRVREHLVDEEISIGDYVLTGGELPAMVVVDTVVRLIPGVLEKPEATKSESFCLNDLNHFNKEKLLEFPHYTRPENYRGWKVPEILLSGNHKKIADWRKQKSLEKTKKLRPDLLLKKPKNH
ncbi:MAG: tRNA (guanosine(37)-N1)-methyltransferase TrmD [Patescibacteria group bacterium]